MIMEKEDLFKEMKILGSWNITELYFLNSINESCYNYDTIITDDTIWYLHNLLRELWLKDETSKDIGLLSDLLVKFYINNGKEELERYSIRALLMILEDVEL